MSNNRKVIQMGNVSMDMELYGTFFLRCPHCNQDHEVKAYVEPNAKTIIELRENSD
jgi:hypothetical protein